MSNRRTPRGLVTLSTVQPEALSWLWPDRLPIGKLVVLDGDPSVGKSTLAVDWAARVSTGTPWPDGSPCPHGDVLLLSAEDGLADTIRPRLDAAGGDPDRVHALTEVPYVGQDDLERMRPVTLADIEAIADRIRLVGARLVVIDVLMAYLPTKVDAHRDQDVRGVLARLADVADQTGAVIVLLRHLNKAAGGNPLYRGGGSIGIVGAARAAFIAAVDPDDPERRVLACTKSNLAAMPASLAYGLASHETGVARVRWYGETKATASQLLAIRGDGDDQSDHDAAADWLREMLAAGPVASTEIYRAADAAGLSKDQAKRAKKRLGATARKDGMDGGWYWALPEGSTEECEERSSHEPAPFTPFLLPSDGSEELTS